MGYFSHTLIATTLALHHEIVCHTRILFFFALFFVSFLYVFFFYPNGSFKWFFFMQILAKWFIPLQRFSNGKNCNDLIVAEKYNQWTWINKRKIMYIHQFVPEFMTHFIFHVASRVPITVEAVIFMLLFLLFVCKAQFIEW